MPNNQSQLKRRLSPEIGTWINLKKSCNIYIYIYLDKNTVFVSVSVNVHDKVQSMHTGVGTDYIFTCMRIFTCQVRCSIFVLFLTNVSFFDNINMMKHISCEVLRRNMMSMHRWWVSQSILCIKVDILLISE